MKFKILKIQIVSLVFTAILFFISILQKHSVINTNKRLMILYIVLIILYWLVLAIILGILTSKNKKDEKVLFINFILISLELLILGVLCGSVDNRIDKLEFAKHCQETTATVYYVKETKGKRATQVGDPEYRER